MKHDACIPADATGPILALQLNGEPGKMKLWPCTVNNSPAKGNAGDALTASDRNDRKINRTGFSR